jgi:Flp pilus assembly protein TadB
MGQLLFFTFIAAIGLLIFFIGKNKSKSKANNFSNKSIIKSNSEEIIVKKAKTEKWMENRWEQAKESGKHKK